MIIAFASGKGGTGKTTISSSLVKAVGKDVCFIDCDVEEPNGHIFLNPDIESCEDVKIPVPEVNETLCTGCGKCARVCQFNAIVSIGKTKAMVFSDLCHGCGACEKICPTGAIKEVFEPVGHIDSGRSGDIKFISGTLNIGKAMAPPVIRALKKYINKDELTILDCPPGTSCPMITAVTGSDYAVLVTEPTPFGLNDLKLAVETIRLLKIPFGVAINRCDGGDDRVKDYCKKENINIILEIPDSREIAESYSRGESLIDSMPLIKKELLKIIELSRKEAVKYQRDNV